MTRSLAENVRIGHEVGWSFTPLAGKKPVLKGWQSLPRESVEQAMEWAPMGNVGLRTGRISGVVVIDADPGADTSPLDLPETVTALTGRPGAKHLYFRHDGALGNSSGKLGPNIDVKADGGQVVFVGSVHPDTGATYRWAEGRSPQEIALAELPADVLKMLGKADAPRTPAPQLPISKGLTREQRYAQMALRLELNAIHSAEEGQRNDTLNKASFSMGTLIGGGCLERAEVEKALHAAGESVGLPAEEVVATVQSGLAAGIQRPRQVSLRQDVESVVEDHDAVREPGVSLLTGRYAMDLYGNADRFLHLFGQDVHWCEDRGKWFVWNGKCWRADAIRQVHHMGEMTMRAMAQETQGNEDASKWACKCSRDGRPAREMLDVVKHRRPIAIDSLDRHPWLLGAANGVINLRTGQLLPHDRKYLITTLSPASYQPDAPCPRWEQFLVEIMAGNTEMIEALQRMAGYFLTGDISVQILPILFGPGANGKNVFLDTLTGIMGPYAEEAPEGLITVRRGDEHPTEIADLHGKRLIVASESEEGRKMRIGLVKKITGNKYLKGRFMRQDYFQFERTHKTVLVTNNRPIVAEASNAIWRRLRLIPFTVVIPESKRDKQLTEKLVAEWPGILAWAVRGCLDWQQRQCDLEFPQPVMEATEQYRNDSDHVADFIAECCINWHGHESQNMKTPKESVYLSYSSWCKSVGEDLLTRNAFNSRMRIHGFEDRAAKMHGDSKTRKCWLHLTLQGGTYDG